MSSWHGLVNQVDVIHLNELDAYTQSFAQCDMRPLRVSIQLVRNGRMTDYDAIHLDGLLARAVITEATQGKGLRDQEDGYWIPLPLKMLWRDEEGYPLWAASVIRPISPMAHDTYVRHKRNSGGHFHNRSNLQTRNGPWMERRIPTPVIVCENYEARCIGNLEAVQTLLDMFTHVGKLRLGRVHNIIVEPADYDDADIWLDGLTLIKPMPAEAGLLAMWPDAPTEIGWTPPHWKPSLFRSGWRAGTRVFNLMMIDYFERMVK